MFWIPLIIGTLLAGGIAVYVYRVYILNKQTLNQIKREVEQAQQLSCGISYAYAKGNYSNVNIGLYDKGNNHVANIQIEIEERLDIQLNKKIYLTN